MTNRCSTPHYEHVCGSQGFGNDINDVCLGCKQEQRDREAKRQQQQPSAMLPSSNRYRKYLHE